MKSFVYTLCCLALLTAFAEKQPFERYQSIVDRQMFGPLPPGFDPTKSPSEVQKSSALSEKELTQEQEKLQSSIHFSMINLTPEGQTEVGFTDNSDPKTPVNYLLKVGETRNGWTVKEADAVAATMTIAKGEIEVALSLGGNSAKDGGTSKAGGAEPAASAGAGVRRAFGGLSGGRPGLLNGSLRSRRRQREQQEQAAKAQADAAAAEKEAERQAQAEQEKQQREAERAEQRQQLLAIQEELKRVREAKANEAPASSDGGESGEGSGDAEN